MIMLLIVGFFSSDYRPVGVPPIYRFNSMAVS